MGYIIRKAGAGDRDFLLHANCEIDKASGILRSNFSKNIEDVFAGKCECLLAEIDKKPIAMTLFSRVYWADRGEGVYISQIFVEKKFRGKGVMKHLLREALLFYPNTAFLTCLVGRKNQKMLSCMKNFEFCDENMASFAINKDDFFEKVHFFD